MTLCCYADNYLTSEALIVPSSLTPVANPSHIEKFAAGSATMELQGTFSASDNKDYVILISYADNIAGIYRYDWSDQLAASTWNAVNVTIVPNVWQTLNNGVQIRFIAGAYTPQLLVGDRFRFHLERPYRPGLAIDLNRENEMRSGVIGGSGTYYVVFPFAVATTPAACILFDHNLASNVTIRLQASTTSNFAATPYNEVIPWALGKIRFRLTGTNTYAYWRLQITSINAAAYVAISSLYLGSELLFSKEMDIGMEAVDDLFGGSDEGILARGQGRYGIKPKRWTMTFSHRAPADDLAKFQTLLTLTRTSRSQRPFYLVFDSVTGLEIFEMVHMVGALRQQHQFLDRMTPSVDLLQVVRTAA